MFRVRDNPVTQQHNNTTTAGVVSPAVKKQSASILAEAQISNTADQLHLAGQTTKAAAAQHSALSNPLTGGGTLFCCPVSKKVMAHNPAIQKDDKESLQLYLERETMMISNVKLVAVMSGEPFLDLRFMPLFVEHANAKNPQRNLYFSEDIALFFAMLDSLVTDNVPSARLVVNIAPHPDVHFVAFDYALVAGKSSVIAMEPLILQGKLHSVYQQVLDRFANQGMPCSIIWMGLQSSDRECGIFALTLLNKMCEERRAMNSLHAKNLQGELPPMMTSEEAYRLLPASFFKHAQSPKRVMAFLNENPAERDKVVNKRGETLESRQKRFTTRVYIRGGRENDVSLSIFEKRRIQLQRAESLISKRESAEEIKT